jgi:hypothetical protein
MGPTKGKRIAFTNQFGDKSSLAGRALEGTYDYITFPLKNGYATLCIDPSGTDLFSTYITTPLPSADRVSDDRFAGRFVVRLRG